MMKYLILPPVSLFVLIAIGWLLAWRWRRTGRTIMALSFVTLFLLCLPVVSGWLMYPLQSYSALDPDRIPPGVGAIVVLSADMQGIAPEYGVDIPGPLGLERLRYGAWLHRRTQLPILVSGGRVVPWTTPLARQMRQILVDEFGVPVRWVEDRSTDTHENAARSAEMLKRDGIGSVLLVTHAWHMRRAMAAFQAAGLAPVAAPTRFIRPPTPVVQDFIPDASALRASSYAVHEWIGLLWYYVSGYTKSFL
jgi:uncharacterized SAM-binding protein YcdF (DUF218 family)